MKNRLKNLIIFSFAFICFFAFNNNVKAENATCNYRIDSADSGTIDVTLTYDKSNKNSTVNPTINYHNTNNSIDVQEAKAKFTIADVSRATKTGCPKMLYGVTTSKSTGGYLMDFYLNESDTKGKKGNKTDFELINTTDYDSKDTCVVYLNSDTYMDKVIIYYDKNGNTTPTISYTTAGGSFDQSGAQISNKNMNYVAKFSSSELTSCPSNLYVVTDNSKKTKYFYLKKPSSGSYETFGASKSIIIESDTDDRTTCEKIKNVKDYITMIYTILRYAVPAIIVIFSTFEFFGVVLSGEDDKMEKAKKHFVYRLLIGIVVLLVPFVLEFILNLAGIINGDLSDVACKILG